MKPTTPAEFAANYLEKSENRWAIANLSPAQVKADIWLAAADYLGVFVVPADVLNELYQAVMERIER